MPATRLSRKAWLGAGSDPARAATRRAGTAEADAPEDDTDGAALRGDGSRAGFPNFETEVKTLIAEGDVVAAWHTHRGQHGGEFAGVPPTGKTVEVHGLELLRVRDGQIAEFWHMDDFLGLMQQIGAVPALSAEGAPTTGAPAP